MRFYKQKRFYIPFIATILLIIAVVIFLSKPSTLIMWSNVDYSVEVKKLDQILNIAENDLESINEFLKNYTPDRYDFFYPALYCSKTAKGDFILARFVGWEEDYLKAYKNAINKAFRLLDAAHFISLGAKHNLSNLTDTHIQFLSFVKSQSLSYLQNTQELIDYLTENNYFNNEEYKSIHIHRLNYIGLYLILLEAQKECFSKEQKTILFQQIQQDYQVLQGIKNETFRKLSDRILNRITKIKERLNDCQ